MILTKMIEIEMDPMIHMIQPEEIEKLADAMEQNQEIMVEIKKLVDKGGENLDVITEDTIRSLNNVKKAEQEIC